MKKLILILSIILIPLQACAFEDYIFTSDSPVKSVSSSDNSIVSISPFFTIDNTKDPITVNVPNEVNAEITVKLYDKDVVVKVQVTPDKTIFSNGDDFVFFPLDTPDEPVEILPPPDIRGGDK